MPAEYDVFISYASESWEKAAIFETLLKEQGLKVFRDKSVIEWGENILKAIEKGLMNSKGYLLIIDDHFLDKGWPLFERDLMLYSYAKGYSYNDKHIFAILVNDRAMNEWIASPLTGIIMGHEWSDDASEQKEMAQTIAAKLRAKSSA